MTTLAVLYARPLELALFIILGAMILAAMRAVKQKYFNSPFWCLVLFPGLAILVGYKYCRHQHMGRFFALGAERSLHLAE